MRDKIKEYSYVLRDNDWLQLCELKAPDKNINGYVFSHENRCSGHIVAILPYRNTEEGKEFLMRREAVPCWELDEVIMCSLTGGVDRGSTPKETAQKELAEESGYVVPETKMESLGTCYGSKSSDTIYHLYMVDLTSRDRDQELYIESDLEKSSYCSWENLESVKSCKDPFVGILLLRALD